MLFENHTNTTGISLITKMQNLIFFYIESHMGSTASHMYLVITTAIWMNKSTDQSTNARNVPFGVFGVMLPYKTVRSTHFSDLCVCIKINFFDLIEFFVIIFSPN